VVDELIFDDPRFWVGDPRDQCVVCHSLIQDGLASEVAPFAGSVSAQFDAVMVALEAHERQPKVRSGGVARVVVPNSLANILMLGALPFAGGLARTDSGVEQGQSLALLTTVGVQLGR
jgi:hypothetical protein